jgi:hypothetical protein
MAMIMARARKEHHTKSLPHDPMEKIKKAKAVTPGLLCAEPQGMRHGVGLVVESLIHRSARRYAVIVISVKVTKNPPLAKKERRRNGKDARKAVEEMARHGPGWPADRLQRWQSVCIVNRQKSRVEVQGGGIMPKGKKQKSLDHEHHLKAQREKEQKKKEKRNAGIPSGYKKSK